MATFFRSSAFLSHPITRTNHFSSSSQVPPIQQPSQPQTPLPSQQLKTTSEELPSPATAKVQLQKSSKTGTSTSVESTDWIATTLSRRSGLGAGMALAGFLAIGVLSEQMKTQLQLSQQEANTRYVDKEEEVILSNGIRYYDLRVGGGASAKSGDLVVIEVKGQVQGSGALFVGTFEGGKKPLALLMGSRPYTKGICEGIEYVLRTMKAGGKRRVIVPPSLGYGEEGADLGSGFQIPPAATLEYVIEVENVSIAAA